MRRHILPIIVLPTLLFWSATALAAERFCLRLPPDNQHIYDASPRTQGMDYLEDYGRRGGGDWGIAGMNAHIETAGTGVDVFGSTWCSGGICLIIPAPLDSNGCTPFVNTPGVTLAETFRIRYTQSGSFSNGSSYQILNCASSNPSYPSCASATNVIENVAAAAGSNVTTYEDLSLEPVNILAWELAFTMKRFPLADTPVTLKYYDQTAAGEHGVSTSSWFTSEGTPLIYVTHTSYKGKFNISHEYGHVYSGLRVSGIAKSDLDSCYNAMLCQHAITSTEYQAVAAMEGFANFLGVAVWYDTSYQARAYIPQFIDSQDGFTIDLEFGELGYPLKYYETNGCSGTCLNGVGVELDWARTFWDLYTNYNPGPGMNSIALVFDEIHPWPIDSMTDDYYTDFHNGVESVLGSTWESRFISVAEANGIDW